jgi:SulP family sulfate permease
MGMFSTVRRDLRGDLREGRVFPALLTGTAIGFIVIIIMVSHASLLFSGPLSGMLGEGIGILIAGSIVSMLILAFTSSLPSVVCPGQDAAVPLLVMNIGALATRFALLPPGTAASGELEATVLALIAASSLMTGILFFAVGRLRLSGLVRTIPYPVMGGFLAGTGWLLAKGGIEVMAGMPLTAGTAGGFFEPLMLLRWLPGIFFAFATFILITRIANPFTLPACIAGAIAIAYVLFALTGLPIAEARQLGLLMQPVHSSPALSVFTPDLLSRIRWEQLLPALPAIFMTPFIAMLSTVLNMAGIESSSGIEMDHDRELTRTGAANFLMGFIPSSSAFISLSLSMIGIKTRVKSRLIGITGALVLLLVLLFGTSILGFVPKPVIGGFLVILGIFFLFDWIIDSPRKMPLTDYLIVWAILIAVIVLGFMEGVALGLGITIVLFLGRISRVPACRAPSNGATLHSRTARPLPERRLLEASGDSIRIYELEGYLFFGSAAGFVSTVLGKPGTAETPASPPSPDIILVDFSAVSGFDVSAVDNFTRLVRRLGRKGSGVALSAAPERFRKLLEHQAGKELYERLRWCSTLDEALAWAEDRLLVQASLLVQADSIQGKEARGRLIDQVSDSLLDELARRERVEGILADPAIAPCLRNFKAGEIVLAAASPSPGFCLVASGTVSEQDAGTKLRIMGQGDCFAAEALAGHWVSHNAFTADSDATVAMLTPGLVAELETSNPALALEIHKAAISRLAG